MNLLRTGMILLVSSVLIAVAVRAVVWGRLRERRLRAPSIHPVPPEALPLALAPVYRAASRVLAPLGFVPTGARRVEGLDAAQEARPEKVYVHPESHGLALVGPPLPGMGDRPYAVTFVHRVEGGPVVATFDGLSHLLPGTPPGWECHDHDLNDLGRQWALHRQSVEIHRGGARPGALPLDEWNAIETRGLERMLTRWAERKWILPAGGGASTSWRFSSRTAWSLAGRVIAGQRRVLASEARAARARANQQLWRSSLAPVNDAFTRELEEARAAAMAWCWRCARKADRRRRNDAASAIRRRVAIGVAAPGTAVLAAGVGWPVAVLLCGVLALHEVGHAIGQRLVQRAGRDRIRPTEPFGRTLVHLMGPLPGLAIGLAGLWQYLEGGSPWWLVAATFALTINYVFLLPIGPLDGGRILETLLLGRFPRTHVGILATGAMGLAAAAWWLRDPVLAGLSLGLLISVRGAWEVARALVRIRPRLTRDLGTPERALTIFRLLQEPEYWGTPATRRERLATSLFDRLDDAAAPAHTVLAGALLYLTFLVGVPLGVRASLRSEAPALWTAVAGIWQPRDGSRDQGEAGGGPSRPTISEASVVGR